ncbi:MAG: hypothetical protein M2R45_03044 [Verrucomicrobia subdivision 3 bacterium]|nr:hypothetical protein [Limisphaerales bacterium]MCS1415565.1 hypothetical protein [Limisphaerales bacterium]
MLASRIVHSLARQGVSRAELSFAASSHRVIGFECGKVFRVEFDLYLRSLVQAPSSKDEYRDAKTHE